MRADAMTDVEAKRKAAFREIDTEVERLRAIAAEKDKTRQEDEKRHPLDQDWTMQNRLKGEIGKVNEAIEKLLAQRNDVEIGVVEPRPVQQAPRVKREWRVKNLPEPEYPEGARTLKDRAAIEAGHDAFQEFYADQVKIHFRDQNVDPDAVVTMQLFAEAEGRDVGLHHWASARVHELERRFAELEAKAMTYGGTWKEDTAYGLGTACTDRGSMWLVQRATTDRPGTSDAWRLIVKQGQVR